MTMPDIRLWKLDRLGYEPAELPDMTSLDAITRHLADGFYSTFRTYGGGTRVVGLKAHLRRLYGPVPAPDVGEDALRRQLSLLLKDYHHEARVRVVVTGRGRIYIMIEPLRLLPRDVYEKGVRGETADMARDTPRLKSTSFIAASSEERRYIAQNDIFEALLVKNGTILEGMTSNFFYILRPERSEAQSKEELYTAQRGVLLGVTRRTVIHVARRMGLGVRYQPLKRDQLQVPREAFITSSSRGIIPVIQIDDVIVGSGKPGQITKRLSAAFETYVLAKAERLCRAD